MAQIAESIKYEGETAENKLAIISTASALVAERKKAKILK